MSNTAVAAALLPLTATFCRVSDLLFANIFPKQLVELAPINLQHTEIDYYDHFVRNSRLVSSSLLIPVSKITQFGKDSSSGRRHFMRMLRLKSSSFMWMRKHQRQMLKKHWTERTSGSPVAA